MTRRNWKKYLPKKVRIGVSGRFYPVYGSIEWAATPRRRRQRR